MIVRAFKEGLFFESRAGSVLEEKLFRKIYKKRSVLESFLIKLFKLFS